MSFSTSFISETGGRQNNEDYYGFLSVKDTYCWAVADGLGGHSGGEIASKLAVEKILESFEGNPEISSNALKLHFEYAQNKLLEFEKNNLEYKSMRTTLVVLIANGNKAVWGHIGDSRLYFLRKGKLQYKTSDHSVAYALASAGEISFEDIKDHEDRSKLLKVLGDENDFRPSISESKTNLKKGDSFLLCTDGFWEHLTEKKVEITLRKSVNNKEWLKRLADRVEEKQTERSDNYTAITIMLNRSFLWFS